MQTLGSVIFTTALVGVALFAIVIVVMGIFALVSLVLDAVGGILWRL